MLRRNLFRQICRFCTNKDDVQKTQSTLLTDAEKQFDPIPVHLKPYNKQKYEVPSKKIKKNSGYALIQLEPFPRAKIMKICYHILHQVKIGIPETSTYRILIEERTKYVMDLTDKEEDIEQLQKILGCDTIELFLIGLREQLDYIKILRVLKPWEMKPDKEDEEDYINEFKKYEDEKFHAYKRGKRPDQRMI